MYNRVSLQWLSRLVSQIPGWGTASLHVTMASKSLLHLEHIGDFILVLWGLMHHAIECVTFVIYTLSWTFSGSSTLRITSVYTDNPWVIFLLYVRKPLIRVYFVAVVICGCTVYMWQRLSHKTVQWLPGTMRQECVIVIRTGPGGMSRLCFRMRSNCGRLNL